VRRSLKPPADTRQQLLSAGAAVFAARGFRNATVREISRRAGSNVAAVNYHFGGKEGLYSEVLALGHQTMMGARSGTSGRRPEVRLEQFIRNFLQRILTESPESDHAQLMFREMIEPTGALDRVVAHFIKPMADELGDIVRELLGPGFSLKERQHAGLSIVSQILNYKHCRPVIARLFPKLPMDPSQIEPLTRHISAFSLAALRGLRSSRQRTAPRATIS